MRNICGHVLLCNIDEFSLAPKSSRGYVRIWLVVTMISNMPERHQTLSSIFHPFALAWVLLGWLKFLVRRVVVDKFFYGTYEN